MGDMVYHGMGCFDDSCDKGNDSVRKENGMKAKYVKYLVKGVQADAREEFDKELKKVKAQSDQYFGWWQEEEAKREALEKEVEALKAELADAKTVIAGYRETMKEGLGIREDERLSNLQFEKGVINA